MRHVYYGPEYSEAEMRAELAAAAAKGRTWKFLPVASDQSWGAASTQLVHALMDEHALAIDERVGWLVTLIGIPSAFLLHGYVGFIFGSVKANPWWSSPLMPVVFIFSATSGAGQQLACSACGSV